MSELTVLESNAVTRNVTGITHAHGYSKCYRSINRDISNFYNKRRSQCECTQDGRKEICTANLKRATYYKTHKGFFIASGENEPSLHYEYFSDDTEDAVIPKERKESHWNDEYRQYLIDIEIVPCGEKIGWNLQSEYDDEQKVIALQMTNLEYSGTEAELYLVQRYRNAFNQDQLVTFFMGLHLKSEMMQMRHENAIRLIAEKMNQAGHVLSF